MIAASDVIVKPGAMVLRLGAPSCLLILFVGSFLGYPLLGGERLHFRAEVLVTLIDGVPKRRVECRTISRLASCNEYAQRNPDNGLLLFVHFTESVTI